MLIAKVPLVFSGVYGGACLRLAFPNPSAHFPEVLPVLAALGFGLLTIASSLFVLAAKPWSRVTSDDRWIARIAVAVVAASVIWPALWAAFHPV